MKGVRQSSSLSEVGKRRRGVEERAAARRKKAMGQVGLGEGKGESDGGLLGSTLPCIPSCSGRAGKDAVTCWVTPAASLAEVSR